MAYFLWLFSLEGSGRCVSRWHSRHLWVWLGQRYHTRRGQRSRVVIPGDPAIDFWSSEGAPKDTSGALCPAESPACSDGSSTGCGVLEGWGTPFGESFTVILKSPLTPPDTAPPRVPGRMLEHSRGAQPCWHSGVFYDAPRWSCPIRRTWTLHESLLSVLNAQRREAVIVTVLRCQETTTLRNGWVIRSLKRCNHLCYAEFTLHNFNTRQIAVVFTLCDYLGLHSVAAMFTLHDGLVTGGFTLHDFTIGIIADNSVWSTNYVSQQNTREKW